MCCLLRYFEWRKVWNFCVFDIFERYFLWRLKWYVVNFYLVVGLLGFVSKLIDRYLCKVIVNLLNFFILNLILVLLRLISVSRVNLVKWFVLIENLSL